MLRKVNPDLKKILLGEKNAALVRTGLTADPACTRLHEGKMSTIASTKHFFFFFKVTD